MNIQQFNQQEKTKAKQQLFNCCGSTTWTESMLEMMPFYSVEEMQICADEVWKATKETDWKEAFTHHPVIGDLKSLKEKFASTLNFTTSEQAGVKEATDDVLMELQRMNEKYQKKYGYIFIICATGKSAGEMLSALKERMENNPEREIRIAAEEQHKIIHLRIEKLFV
ncbi:MAG: 2-oxo-4-hydroxy-4-carboxy-5-ureidoimidazoline decarboxylase [Bacteroidota bacterium]